MSVRIVSYNLLVPIYAQPEHYVKCQSKYLETDYRWKLIENELEREITQHENTIICLQELSITTLPMLELFLHRFKYSLHSNLYGTSSNGYMGVAIAVPISMNLTNVSYIKISDRLRSVCKLHESSWAHRLYQFVRSKFVPVSLFDSWETSMQRNNTLICLELNINGKKLYVGTYHMPCLYKDRGSMAIHSSMVKDVMFELAEGNDLILTGDFNIKPSDLEYRALTEQDYCNTNFPMSNNYEILYRPNVKQVFKSAYQVKNGSEPIYTNFSYTEHTSTFCETLDYIFFSGQLKVESVLELPEQPISESYPDENHPSDHIMIAATFQLF